MMNFLGQLLLKILRPERLSLSWKQPTTTIKNYFYRYPRTVREAVKAVTVDMSGAHIQS